MGVRDTVVWVSIVLLWASLIAQWFLRVKDWRAYHEMREQAERYRALRNAVLASAIRVEHGSDIAKSPIASASDLDWLARELVVQQCLTSSEV